MTKPISSMTPGQIQIELNNFQRFRVSKDPIKRRQFESNRVRYDALIEASDKAKNWSIRKSLDLIRKAAKEGRFVCYKDLADANGIGWTKAYRQIGGHLWDLIEYSHDQFGIVISAIVVNKDHLEDGSMDPETLKGFVRASAELGYEVGDPEEFLRDRQREVFRQFSA